MSAGRKQKNEAAFVAVIAAVVGNALTGLTSQDDQTNTRSLPMFSIEHMGGPESPLGSGCYRDKVIVRIRSTADKSRAQNAGAVKAAHGANVALVTEALLVDQVTRKIDMPGLAARLSAAQTEYHCFGVINRGQIGADPEARTFVDAFLFEVINGETDCT